MRRFRSPLATAAVIPATAVLVGALLAGCGSNSPAATTEDIGTTPVTGSTASPVAAPAPLPLPPSGVVRIDGVRGTLTTQEAQKYAGAGHDVDETYVGTGTAFENLCTGKTDLVDSSTPITDKEIDDCHAHGLDLVQFEVAADAVVVAIRNETNVGGDCLTTTQVRNIFRAGSPITNWSQVGFDDVPLHVGGPDLSNDDFGFFAQDVLGAQSSGVTELRSDYRTFANDDGTRTWVVGRPALQRLSALEGGRSVALSKAKSQLTAQLQLVSAARTNLSQDIAILAEDRTIGAGTRQIDRDQTAVYDAQGQLTGARRWVPMYRQLVRRDTHIWRLAARATRMQARMRGRFAYFGFSYYQVYEDQLRPMEISLPYGRNRTQKRENCIFANEQTIMNGQYPFARRMLLTTTTSAMQRPEVRGFLVSLMRHARDDAAAADLVAVDQATMDEQLAWARGKEQPTLVQRSQPLVTAQQQQVVPAQ